MELNYEAMDKTQFDACKALPVNDQRFAFINCAKLFISRSPNVKIGLMS